MINEEHAEYKKCPQCQWWWVATATAAVVTSDIPQQQTGKQQTNSAFNFAAIYLLSLLLGPVPAKEPAVRVKARSTPEPAQESRTTSRPNHNQLLPLAVDVRQPVEISLEEQVRVLNGVPLSPILVGGQPESEPHEGKVLSL
eukprot:s1863_g8.t1